MKLIRNTSLSVLLLLSLMCVSCAKKSTVPPDIIQPEQMVDILEEAQLLEAFFSTQTHFHFDTFRVEMKGCYDSLFSKYDVNSDMFDSSLSWYSAHPDIFQPICDSVLQRINAAADIAIAKFQEEEPAAEEETQDVQFESGNSDFLF